MTGHLERRWSVLELLVIALLVWVVYSTVRVPPHTRSGKARVHGRPHPIRSEPSAAVLDTDAGSRQALAGRDGRLAACARYHRGNRSRDDLEVQPKGPIVDIFQVEANPILEVLHLVPAIHLPEAGKSRLYA